MSRYQTNNKELAMIDFEEELKRFEPSKEVDEVEAEIQQRDITDLTDILRQMSETADRR